MMKSLVTKSLAIFLLISVLPSAATSQTKEGNIRELLEITGTERLTRQSMNLVWPHIWELVTKAHPELPDDLIFELEAEFLTAVDESMSVFFEGVIEIYSGNFTEEEISELLAWYKTSLGQKTIRVLPRLLQQSMEWGQIWGKEIVAPRAIERVTERLRQKGYEL